MITLRYWHVLHPGGHHLSITASFTFVEPGETEAEARDVLERKLLMLSVPGEWFRDEDGHAGAVSLEQELERS